MQKLRFRFFSKFRFFWSDRDMSIFFGCQILPGFTVCLDFGKILKKIWKSLFPELCLGNGGCMWCFLDVKFCADSNKTGLSL